LRYAARAPPRLRPPAARHSHAQDAGRAALEALLSAAPPPRAQLIRDLIADVTGDTPPEAPPPPVLRGYGRVDMGEGALLLEQLGALVAGDGVAADYPDVMEEYGQSCAPRSLRMRRGRAGLGGLARCCMSACPCYKYSSSQMHAARSC